MAFVIRPGSALRQSSWFPRVSRECARIQETSADKFSMKEILVSPSRVVNDTLGSANCQFADSMSGGLHSRQRANTLA